MATHIASGFSSSNDTVTAFKDAAIMAKNQTGMHKNDLVVIAATPSYTADDNQHTLAALESLHRILNPENLIGLTVPALILQEGTANKGVSVLTISSDEIKLGISATSPISLLPLHETGLQLARELASRMHSSERHGAIIFCDGVALNHSPLMPGLQEGLGRAFIMAGAISTGGLFCQSQVLRDAIGGLILGGQSSFAISAQHGWQPLGKPRIITDSVGNIIRLIDGQPAVSIYKDYFPEHFANQDQLETIGLLYPLGLNTATPKEYIIKNPVSVLPDGSLICQGAIPRGAQVHLMIGDKDACRKAALTAALDIRDKLHGKHPKMIFVLASIARKKIFGRSAWQEIKQIKEILGLACPLFGMYTHGEFGSTESMKLQINNGSILIAAIG